jgi:hypothetical protein
VCVCVCVCDSVDLTVERDNFFPGQFKHSTR